MSTKYQITLPLDLASEMKSEAARLEIPLAQFIRETMKERLARLQQGRRGGTPLSWLDKQAIETGETDLASRVDEILYH